MFRSQGGTDVTAHWRSETLRRVVNRDSTLHPTCQGLSYPDDPARWEYARLFRMENYSSGGSGLPVSHGGPRPAPPHTQTTTPWEALGDLHGPCQNQPSTSPPPLWAVEGKLRPPLCFVRGSEQPAPALLRGRRGTDGALCAGRSQAPQNAARVLSCLRPPGRARNTGWGG